MGLTTTMPSPLDEYPVHQTPLPMDRVATSDRNFYDRCYLNLHDQSGDVFMVTGLGVYPNLGVIDAYAAARTGDEIHSVRFSDALGERSLDQQVGGYRIDVAEPLRQLDLHCQSPDGSLDFDLHWTAAFPAVQEEPHLLLAGRRPILDASRFCQMGRWSGQLKVGDREFTVTPDECGGARDRSWGIRPSGEPDPPGRSADETPQGFWWLYAPLQFGSCAVIIIMQENPDGFRTVNDARRVCHGRPHRAAGLAAARDPLPVRHPASGRRPDRAHRPRGQAAEAGTGDRHLGPAARRRGLQRRPRLVTRPLDGQGLERDHASTT